MIATAPATAGTVGETRSPSEAGALTPPENTERQAVADVVVKLLGYSRWPAGSQVVRVCIDDAAAAISSGLNGQATSNGRLIDAKLLKSLDTASVTRCDAVYLVDTADSRRKTLVSELIGKPVLVIVEKDQACEVGSMFCLDIREERVTFRINLDSIARSSIRVHPGVLQLGRRTAKAQ
ncbi:YfiR family protein [Cupriavidus agavae]|uniref:YfiR family protein n=1 Tax=Cupriavidus agavae TaxID=1001822 RepID=UPI00102C5214|nr:YfiR family protein [Cupriavidus agavae]